MKRTAPKLTTLLGLATLGGCAATGAPTARPASFVPVPRGGPMLERVMGQTGPTLTQMFGAPIADVREGTAQKLQYGNATCVLDAYLYPNGKGQPVVSYVDARQADGSPIDRASCVGALQIGKRK
ncbi:MULTISPECIES: hypothetical protein [unclassified Sphingomonas]|jgi:hypothetical protein|uniref:hypothetical protein n=1 Tax=unclassified Sphingomonas TaxID=196159 RepID=UPI001F57FA92|nr:MULTISPECIES: hypothetical protein [unclassified Sphingomonas]